MATPPLLSYIDRVSFVDMSFSLAIRRFVNQNLFINKVATDGIPWEERELRVLLGGFVYLSRVVLAAELTPGANNAKVISLFFWLF